MGKYAYWVPGAEVEVGGVLCRATITNKVPDKVWTDAIKLRQQAGFDDSASSTRECIHAVGILDGYRFVYYDHVPSVWYESGSGTKGAIYHTVLVPVSYFQPQENEFGLIHP